MANIPSKLKWDRAERSLTNTTGKSTRFNAATYIYFAFYESAISGETPKFFNISGIN